MKPWAGYLGVLILALSPFLPWITHRGVEMTWTDPGRDAVWRTTRHESLVTLAFASPPTEDTPDERWDDQAWCDHFVRKILPDLAATLLPGGGIVELLVIFAAAAICGVALFLRGEFALWVPGAFTAPFLFYVWHATAQGVGRLPYYTYYRRVETNPTGWIAAGLGIVLIAFESLLWWRAEWRRRRKVSLRTFDQA